MKPNTWAMLCHLCGLIGYLANGLGSIIGPLVVWIVKKDELPLIDQHGKEAINFNISVAIYTVILASFAIMTFGIGLFLTIPLGAALVIFHIVCIVMASIKANNGEFFRYPLCIRLLK